ncbi:lamin tail domain-containing protein [Flavilitoribacter nigricans]|uniref:LTD domain-containing protein n=1 Tax=Flavilitoribacter nigricans (strain ATCC 23147 / DSM 23189 / NBRC 102662 / NCIMB 1420 / SS-2) TaxID=1122177 RepID=A0A2D0NJU8_FLAN2|nr:lamin tail domain-containing protein [Flavilitoribacter nigricans]PHN08479.1 hypothetical protein CRP01_00775 [Flavilitoribacter nigricans DSM 23189 = NBRC 102662]
MSRYTLLVLSLFLNFALLAQTKHFVTVSSNVFSPDALSIEIGDTVVWTNTSGSHNVNGTTDTYPENPVGFGNGNASSSAWTYEFVFDQAGLYNYRCDPHFALGMTGQVVVSEPTVESIVITEIMYNPPGSDADLEYLELYNAGNSAINLIGYSFSGFDFTFPGFNLNAGDYVIVAADSVFFTDTFGVPAFEMDGGGLSNGGELIQLLDGDGNLVDEVDYEPDGDWPSEPDGLGAALVLCDPASDNNDPASWGAARTATGIFINGFELYANPRGAGQCANGPLVSFLSTEMTVSEAAGTLMIPVALSQGDPMATTTVDVGIGAATTATLDADYTFTPTTVTFTPGATSDTVMLSLTIIDDTDLETLDTIALELSDPSAEATIDVFADQSLIIIQDNDAVIPDLAITEIMYNPPESGTDSLEFIEIYNYGDTPADLTGYTFTAGVTATFPDFILGAGDYIVLAVNPEALLNQFGVSALPFTGALSNGGESIELSNPGGTVVLQVTYDRDGDWPADANGGGASLVLCDPTADPTDGANWSASTTDSGVIINGSLIYASPGAADACAPPMEDVYPLYDISVLNTENANGVADSIGVDAEVQGIVYGVNLRPGGLQFTVIEADGDGIGVFSSSEDYDYTVMEGDMVSIQGTIGQFNGLTQINVDTISLMSSGNMLLDPLVVTELGEGTESQLITLENVTLADPTEWEEGGGSFNVSVTDGTNTYSVRIDSDVNIAGTAAPAGAFNITGIGDQFDSSDPYTEGYQLLPRYLEDIELVSQTVDPELARSVRAYPNPAGNYLQLELSDRFDALRIHNAFGQEVLRKYDPQANERLDVSQLPKGLYTLTFVQTDRIWSMQIVKQ